MRLGNLFKAYNMAVYYFTISRYTRHWPELTLSSAPQLNLDCTALVKCERALLSFVRSRPPLAASPNANVELRPLVAALLGLVGSAPGCRG